MTKLRYWIAAVVILMGGVSGVAQVTQPFTFPDAVLQNYTVKIDVEDQIAHVNIEQTYFNPTDQILEEIYLFPVPQGVTITSLTLCESENSCAEGELMGATEARQLYQQIVSQTRDPALLEYIDDRSFQVRIFPINPDSTQTIKVSYQQVLERRGGLVEVLYPITSQKLIEQMYIEATLRDDEAIGNVYSPSHTISQERVSENEMKISFEVSDLKSDEDFKVFFAVEQEGMALDVLSFRPTDEDGYFLMLVSWPQIDQEPLPKDIVFVLDTSGSMSGEKINQARASLEHAIGRLNPEDRFGLITFSDQVRSYQTDLLAVSDLDRIGLADYISNVDAAGGTNIHSALMRGLNLFDDTSGERPQMVVFLTDGLPTAGETNIQNIVNDILGENSDLECRIFTFGVGYDVNTVLLDTLSIENGGFTTYVEPGENIEDSIATFYDRVGAPLIWDLDSVFNSVDVYDTYPVNLPDLFAGDMLEIVGRYRSGGEGEVFLTGQGVGISDAFTEQIELIEGFTHHDYLAKIWAGRAIAYLLTQIRLHGSDPELVERVRELGDKHGIVTPYNSLFAAPEDSDDFQLGTTGQSPSGISFDTDAADATGQGAVQRSEALKVLASATTAQELEAYEAQAQQQIGQNIYELREGRWVDMNRADLKPDFQIQFGSDAYFELASRSDLREVMKLGSNLILTTTSDQGVELVLEIGDTGISDVNQLPQLASQTAAQIPVDTSNVENNNQTPDNTENNGNANNQNTSGNDAQNNETGNNQNDATQDATESSGGINWLLVGLVAALAAGAAFLLIRKQ